MGAYQQYGTDKDLERDGVVVEYDGYSITVARAGGANTRFLKATERLRKKYGSQIDDDVISDSVLRSLMVEVYAETVVLGWDGMADESGHPLDCTKSNIVKVFTDLPDLFSDVCRVARSIRAFAAKVDADDAKNSARSSSSD